MAVLGLVSLILEPAATMAYLSFPGLDQVGDVRNLSPYQFSPLLWLALVVALAIIALATGARARRLAPGRVAVGPGEPAIADVHAVDTGRRQGRSGALAEASDRLPPDSP